MRFEAVGRTNEAPTEWPAGEAIPQAVRQSLIEYIHLERAGQREMQEMDGW